MSTIKTNDGTEIYYKGWDKGQPVVFSQPSSVSASVRRATDLHPQRDGCRDTS